MDQKSWVHFFGGPDPLFVIHPPFEELHRLWTIQQERRAAQRTTAKDGRNLDELGPILDIRNTEVCSWTPERDGKGKVTEVHLLHSITLGGKECKIAVRYRTKGALLGLVDALRHHCDDVWPPQDPGQFQGRGGRA